MPTVQNASNVWIFQGNPSRYQNLEALKEQDEEYWNLRQHAKLVKVDDRVLLWICGQNAGIYAIGTVKTTPTIMADSEKGQSYWIDPIEGKRPIARVLVHFDYKLLERPLLKKFLKCVPALEKLQIFRNPRLTNYPVTLEEWQELKKWLDSELKTQL